MKEYVIKYDVISTTNGSSIVMSENIKSSKIGNELKKEVSDFLDNKMGRSEIYNLISIT